MRQRSESAATAAPAGGSAKCRRPGTRHAIIRRITWHTVVAATVSAGAAFGASAIIDDGASTPAAGTMAGDSVEAPFPAGMIALLASDRTGGDLVGGWSWTVEPSADNSSWSATLVGEVEGNSLLEGQASDTLAVALYGYVFSSSGDPIGHIHQQHRLPLADHEGRLRAAGLRVVHSLRLTSSPVSVRLVIENTETQRLLVATVDLASPFGATDRLELLPPLVPDVADAWLVVTPAGEQSTAGRITLHGTDFVAATRVVAVNGQPTELVTVATGVGPSLPIAARVIDRNGITRSTPAVVVGSRLDPGGPPPAMVSTVIAAMDLPPDLYLLELALDDGRSPPRVLQAFPLAVTEAPRRVVWTAAGIAAEEAHTADPSQLEARELGAIGAQTAALLLSGQRGGEVLGSLIWSVDPTGFTGDVANVPFFVELEGTSLLTAQAGPTLHLGVFAYVISSDGGLAGHLAQGLSLDLRSYGEQLRSSGLKFAGRFELSAGSYVLHLLVRNQDTGGMALKVAQLDVPGDDRPGAMLLPPVFPEPAGSWLVTRQQGLDAEMIGVPIAEARVMPAARAVVESGRPTELYVGTKGWDRSSPISARVTDIQGRHLAEPVLEVADETGVATNRTSFLRATLGALDLPVGWYMLELTLEDETSGARRSRSIPVAVIVNRRPTVWASLGDTTRMGRHPSQAGAPQLAQTPVTNGAVAEGYLAALRVLAAGDRLAAQDRIAALERSVAAVGTSSAMSGLYRMEKKVARELAGAAPEALISIALVHREVFRQYIAAGEDRLADHAWRVAAELAEELPPQVQPEAGPAFTETLLVAIAADLVRTGLMSSAIGLLERVVKRAPNDPVALLALGATYERVSGYAEAVVPLRTLVREHPDSAEGMLRLAVNLARTGSPNEAALQFRQLTTDRAPAWIQVISHQELARLLPAIEAEDLLRAGVERFPSDQALRVQLAQLLDTRGRPWEAGSLIEDVASRARPPETSPRVRYPAWPSLDLERRLVEFDHTAEQSAGTLLNAIDSRTAGPDAS